MKLLVTIYLAFVSLFAAAQTDSELASSEKVAEFTSMLIDYEVVDGKLVALTKRKREYFVYFTNTNGVEVYQFLELKYLSDVFVDCMGNVYVTTIDSAYRLSIADFVQVEEGLDLPTYRSSIQNCEAIFDYTLVRSAENNMLVVEPIDDDVYASTPELNVIHHSSEQVIPSSNKNFSRSRARNSSNMDAGLVADQRNAYVPSVNSTNTDGTGANTLSRSSPDLLAPVPRSNPFPGGTPDPSERASANTVTVNHELKSFKMGDSLWVIDRSARALCVYSSEGVLNRLMSIEGFNYADDVLYDAETEIIYVARLGHEKLVVSTLNDQAELTKVQEIEALLKPIDLMVNDGFLHYVTASGPVKSINRVGLSQQD
jgi:hypothetical protein